MFASCSLNSSCFIQLAKLVHLYFFLGSCFSFQESDSKIILYFSLILSLVQPHSAAPICVEILTQAERASLMSTTNYLSVFHLSVTPLLLPTGSALSFASRAPHPTLGRKNPRGKLLLTLQQHLKQCRHAVFALLNSILTTSLCPSFLRSIIPMLLKSKV